MSRAVMSSPIGKDVGVEHLLHLLRALPVRLDVAAHELFGQLRNRACFPLSSLGSVMQLRWVLAKAKQSFRLRVFEVCLGERQCGIGPKCEPTGKAVQRVTELEALLAAGEDAEL